MWKCLDERRDEQHTQEQVGCGGHCLGVGNVSAAMQYGDGYDVPELLKDARDHQWAESNRVGSDHQKRELPRRGHHQKTIEKVRIARGEHVLLS
jgi:hypothetical protein